MSLFGNVDPLALALGTANANSIANATSIVTMPIYIPQITAAPKSNVADDQDFARAQLIDVIEKTSNAISQLMIISKVSTNPRAYEVLEKLLMRQQDAAAKLVELHNARADIELKKSKTANVSPTTNQVYISNAVFTGTTAELLDKLRGKDRTVIEHDDLLLDDENTDEKFGSPTDKMKYR